MLFNLIRRIETVNICDSYKLKNDLTLLLRMINGSLVSARFYPYCKPRDKNYKSR